MIRLLAILLLGVAGVVGLGMSLCGGMFTLAAVLEKPGQRTGELGSASGFLIIAVPSLIVGLALLALVAHKVRQMARRTGAGARSTDGES